MLIEEPDGSGGRQRKRGRPPEGVLTEAQAAARMLELMREHDAEQTLLERDAQERRRRGVSFRELLRQPAGEVSHPARSDSASWRTTSASINSRATNATASLTKSSSRPSRTPATTSATVML